MKSLRFILFLQIFITLTLFSQVTILRTTDKDYNYRDMGLTTNYLWPGECQFYWGGLFAATKDSYLDSVEIALAFEHYPVSGDTNDILTIDIFRLNKDYYRLKRYYSYEMDLGNRGFPPRFSSNTDNIPDLLKINFRDLDKKIIKVPANDTFFIGVRLNKFHKSSPYELGSNRWLLPDYGLNMGVVGLGGSNLQYKKYSKRYVFYEKNKEIFSQEGKILPAWYSYDYALYIKAYTSTTNNSPGYEIIDSSKAFEPPGIKCSQILEIRDKIEIEPKDFKIYQNYPNPFNPSTDISYYLSKKSKVNIEIFSLLGQKIKNILDTYQDKGYYSIPFDATGLNSGTYLYRVNIMDGNMIILSEMKKMLYLK